MNGKRLKELRHQKGMTQRQVAIECDITQETVYALENGRSDAQEAGRVLRGRNRGSAGRLRRRRT